LTVNVSLIRIETRQTPSIDDSVTSRTGETGSVGLVLDTVGTGGETDTVGEVEEFGTLGTDLEVVGVTGETVILTGDTDGQGLGDGNKTVSGVTSLTGLQAWALGTVL